MAPFSRLLSRTFSTSHHKSFQTPTTKSVSDCLYNERNLKTLVQNFKKFSESDRFRTKTGIYVDTIRRLAAAKRFNWIEEILEDQKKYSDISKEGFAIRLISLYGKSGMFDHAHKVFDEMPERKCSRTVKSFNALLGACVKSKKFDMVDVLFYELPEKLSIMRDVVSYNVVIKALCKMGSLDSAGLKFAEMEKNGLEPDLITFNTLLDGFYGNNRFVDGEKFWGKMMEKNVSPDIISYNSKLVGLISKKMMSEAVELVGKLAAEEVKPDVFSFNALIKGYCNAGNLEEAKRWYTELLKSDCAPNKATFEDLIPLVCERGDFDLGFELCKEIFSQKCLVNAALLQLVLDGLLKESKTEKAKKLLQMANSNNFCSYNLRMASDK